MRTSAHLSRVSDERYEAELRENYRRALAVDQDRMFREIPAADADYQNYRKLQEEHIFPHLDSFDIPTLLVWAEDDATVPVSRGLKLLERIPGAEFHLFLGAAHNAMHDCAAGFN